ncbi:MAG TPA: fused MFS/spermidine synthase [Allosphingosinicella sp.]|nr:fused MFS/spermidine synthase [Allosphingosinicella sp.]
MSEANAEVRVSAPAERFARPLYLATIVTGSFLLFLTQPMVARMALPRLGGAPAVWNSAMLVFQALLLGGYAYAHFLARLKPRLQAGIHLVLFAAASLWLPIGLTAWTLPAAAAPALWAPWFLVASVGPLFFIVSAQAPLMQFWYAMEAKRGEPWALYAASNIGSFAGLLSYPLLFEPLLSLREQSFVWSLGYALLVLLVALCALTIPRDRIEQAPAREGAPPTLRRILCWIALAAVPSGLMLSTTTHLTTDIVAVPLLWVVPLGLYLLSFVVAFADRRAAADFVTALAPLILLIGGGFAFAEGSNTPLFSASIGLTLLFTVAVALHTALYRLRPTAGRSTSFYLAMAFGGMLGGAFCAILAPMLFDWAYEHPLLLLGAALLVPQVSFVPWADSMPRWSLWLLALLALALSFLVDVQFQGWIVGGWALLGSVLVSIVALHFVGRRVLFMLGLLALMMSYGGWSKLYQSARGMRERSYFGIYTVSDKAKPPSRILTNGTTLHGIQNRGPGEQLEPTSYYARRSGVGHALDSAPFFYGQHARIGVVGLGAGTLSCYYFPGQDWRIFEIDPVVVRIARSRFTFLPSCAPAAKIVIGDARLSLSRQPPASLDILAVDAFSSDAIPMHLLTREALAVYARVLSPRGLLLVHISNRYLDLEPVLAAAQKDGWTGAIYDYEPQPFEPVHNLSASIWVAMARDPQALERLKQASGADSYLWRPLKARPGFAGWTDDHASVLPLLESWRNWVPPSVQGR